MVYPNVLASVLCWLVSRLRNPEKAKVRKNHRQKEVIGKMNSGETWTLAESVSTGWSLMNSHWSLYPSKNSGGDCYAFELVGNKMVGNHPINIFFSHFSLLQALLILTQKWFKFR